MLTLQQILKNKVTCIFLFVMHKRKTIVLLAIAVVIIATAVSVITYRKHYDSARWDEAMIAKKIEQNARLVTTEVELQKVVLWDSSKQNHQWTDLDEISKNWFGTQRFVFPVVVKMKFGYDLSGFSSSDIEKVDDNTLRISLPKPRLIDSNPDEIEISEVENFNTGLRGNADKTQIYKARNDIYALILEKQDSILSTVRPEIENNARVILQNLLSASKWNIQVSYK